MAASGGVEQRGAIFARREVVDFILDIAGYTADKPLYELRLLEPSFGAGDFLLPALAGCCTLGSGLVVVVGRSKRWLAVFEPSSCIEIRSGGPARLSVTC